MSSEQPSETQDSQAAHGTAFRGRSALITGASRGIGYAIARDFLGRGASVTITARKSGPLEQAADALRREFCAGAPAGAEGDRVLAAAGNAGHEEDRRAAVQAAVSRFGSLDTLVNNTGINPVFGPLMEADLGAVRKLLDTNVVAALGFVQEAYRAWMAEHGGTVINIASVAALRSTGVISAYGASKAALVRLTEELAWQLAPGIRVNAVAPGVIDTAFAGVLVGEDPEAAARKYPMGRIGRPVDVARTVGFLASDDAQWLTGETVRVDGGLLATGGM